MICKNCGRKSNNDDSNFCDYCGEAFREVNIHIEKEENIKEIAELEKGKQISMFNWLGSMCLSLIPLVGPLVYIVMLFVWSFGKDTATSKKNWARAMLIFILISIILLMMSFTTIMTDPASQDMINEMLKIYN
ncbi:MAG TPA: zinc ribbon domain-containing protein [Clostridiales bacterium]|nr:zinc ribbon domain-containing protein [Clostridiales bacterium]